MRADSLNLSTPLRGQGLNVSKLNNSKLSFGCTCGDCQSCKPAVNCGPSCDCFESSAKKADSTPTLLAKQLRETQRALEFACKLLVISGIQPQQVQ